MKCQEGKQQGGGGGGGRGERWEEEGEGKGGLSGWIKLTSFQDESLGLRKRGERELGEGKRERVGEGKGGSGRDGMGWVGY